MTKRLISVDDAKLAVVRELLGAGTLKETVDGAFDEVIAPELRRRQLLDQPVDGLADFTEPGSRGAAWRSRPTT